MSGCSPPLGVLPLENFEGALGGFLNWGVVKGPKLAWEFYRVLAGFLRFLLERFFSVKYFERTLN